MEYGRVISACMNNEHAHVCDRYEYTVEYRHIILRVLFLSVHVVCMHTVEYRHVLY